MFSCCCAAEDVASVAQFVTGVQSPRGAHVNAAATSHGEAPLKSLQQTADGPQHVSQQLPSVAAARPGLAGGATFSTKLWKRGSSTAMGWRLDCVGEGCIFVSDVAPTPDTPVQINNNSVPENQQIKIGDYIVGIEGQATVTDMVSAIDAAGTSLSVLLRRPHLFHVLVHKGNPALGLELKYLQAGTSLLVADVRDGAVRSQGVDVRKGDRILSINGCQGSVGELLAVLTGTGPLDMEISRCP